MPRLEVSVNGTLCFLYIYIFWNNFAFYIVFYASQFHLSLECPRNFSRKYSFAVFHCLKMDNLVWICAIHYISVASGPWHSVLMPAVTA